VRRADNLATFMCRRLSRNSDSRNPLEPPGPAQTCTGTAVLYIYLNCCLVEESFKMFLEETNYDRSYLIHPLEVKG